VEKALRSDFPIPNSKSSNGVAHALELGPDGFAALVGSDRISAMAAICCQAVNVVVDLSFDPVPVGVLARDNVNCDNLRYKVIGAIAYLDILK